mgnify:CR=1 FL=1
MKQIAFKLAGFVFYFYFCLKSQSYLHEADCLYHGRLYVFCTDVECLSYSGYTIERGAEYGKSNDYRDTCTGRVCGCQFPKSVCYKTKGDYSHLVPVLMDDSRTQILSYRIRVIFLLEENSAADSSERWLLVGQQGNRSECRFPFLYL